MRVLILSVVLAAVYSDDPAAATKCPSGGHWKGLHCYAHTAVGVECEKHMFLAQCFGGKKVKDCRKCASGFSDRCGKMILKNLCHFHAHDIPTSHDKKHKEAAVQDTPQSDDDVLDMSSTREHIEGKIGRMKAKLEANVQLIKKRQQRKATKLQLGLKTKPTPAPVPTKMPTTLLESQYARAHPSNAKAAPPNAHEGKTIWNEMKTLETAAKTQKRHHRHHKQTQIREDNTQVESTGEIMCESHGYDKQKCHDVGCCTFLSGLCWSAVGDSPCLKKGSTTAKKSKKSKKREEPLGEHPVALSPGPGIESGSLSTYVKAGKKAAKKERKAAKRAARRAKNKGKHIKKFHVPKGATGDVVCEEHSYDSKTCGRIGCCTFSSGLCWSAVGKKACHQKHKKKSWEEKHKIKKKHPLAEGHKKHHSKRQSKPDFTPYPTPKATPSPTKSPTPEYNENSEEAESAIEDRIFAANAKAVAAINRAEKTEDAVESAAVTKEDKEVESLRSQLKSARSMTKEQACQAIVAKAQDVCKVVAGQATHCVQECDQLVKDSEEMRPYLSKCLFEWKTEVRNQVCWPEDCSSTIDYFCKPFYGFAIRGYPKGEQAFYSACHLCVLHYSLMSPPIKGHACWEEKMTSQCPSEMSNLPSSIGVLTEITVANIGAVVKGIGTENLPSFRTVHM